MGYTSSLFAVDKGKISGVASIGLWSGSDIFTFNPPGGAKSGQIQLLEQCFTRVVAVNTARPTDQLLTVLTFSQITYLDHTGLFMRLMYEDTPFQGQRSKKWIRLNFE